jgi:hypothetical protein
MTNIYSATSNDSISLEELELYHLLMGYRETRGLDAIPLSVGLSATAGRHALDTRENIWGTGMVLPDGANLHSWSDAPYFGDHRDPEVMWFAPQRLGTSYEGYGFEISAAGFADVAGALAGWQGSPGHDNVIVNNDVWADLEWNAIGIGVDSRTDFSLPFAGRIYHVWFGTDADPGGPPDILGSQGSDVIEGTAFADRIIGNAGDDTISGGTGADTFVLAPGDGNDAVTDFEDGVDLIDLTAFSRADVVSALADVQPGSAVLTLADGTSITLAGLTPQQLTDADVLMAPPGPVNSAPTGEVLLLGTVIQRATLTADASGLADADGLGELSYQWFRDDKVIPAITASTLKLTQQEVGKSIRVEVSYVDGSGKETTVSSAASAVIENANDLPEGSVVIAGSARQGEVLAVTDTLADEDGMGAVVYQWLRDGAAIDGATADEYTLSAADLGALLTVEASYTDGFGTVERVVSDSVGPVSPAFTEVNGDDEDDFLIVEVGSAVVNGGDGDDTVQLPFFVTEFTLQEVAPGEVVGTYGEWSIELSDIEFLEFGTGHQTTIPIEDVISGQAQAKVQKLSDLYLAFFGRAPDREGLEYWQEVILEDGLDLVEISQYFAQSVEFQTLYPADGTNRDFVRSIYNNAFARDPDDGGWDFWTSKLDALDPSDLAARGAFVGTVILGAYSDTSGPRDLEFLSNRHEVSLGYVNRLLMEPEEGKDKAITELLMLVTDDDATVAAAEELLDYVFEDPVTLTGVMTDQGLLESFFG